ncbi:MAG: beta-1,4-galactosyltransferase [Euryarchaeota archaeon]|nr:beta-1,4-galactosyltransferase [Euryarchaeota archaeon]
MVVGTHVQPFERLVRAMDQLAPRLGEEVVIQRGNTGYLPRNARSFAFAQREEMERLNREARIVVTHGGAGSIVYALQSGKPVVAAPRLARYGEHINDHQVELVRALEKGGRVIGVYEIGDLEGAIEKAARMEPRVRPRPPMVGIIRAYLQGMEDGKV